MKRASCKRPLRRYAPSWNKRFFSTLMISNVKSTSQTTNYDCCGRRSQLCGKNWRSESEVRSQRTADRGQKANAERSTPNIQRSMKRGEHAVSRIQHPVRRGEHLAPRNKSKKP